MSKRLDAGVAIFHALAINGPLRKFQITESTGIDADIIGNGIDYIRSFAGKESVLAYRDPEMGSKLAIYVLNPGPGLIYFMKSHGIDPSTEVKGLPEDFGPIFPFYAKGQDAWMKSLAELDEAEKSMQQKRCYEFLTEVNGQVIVQADGKLFKLVEIML
jgi:hypothetical protein